MFKSRTAPGGSTRRLSRRPGIELVRVVFLLIAGWLATQTVIPHWASAEAADRPNIVYIMADDLGYADVGFMGSKEIHTPNLDRLARGGAILDAFYVQPVCSPTRAALLTGRYPTHTGVYTVVRPHAKWGLPLGERTLADALREAGYHTAICGKWHLGEYRREYQPTRRGFDEQYGHFFGALDYFTKLRNGERDWYRNDRPCDDEGYSTHLLGREACRMIRERPKDKPLFLYVPFQAVHGPYQVPDEYLRPYASLKGTRQKYAGMVAAMDEAIGKIVETIDQEGIRNQTLIIFCSDNGGPRPGQITDNGPLRAGKGTIYEGGVRVCACVNWPGRVPAGSRVAQPIHAVDWYPTLVHLGQGSLKQRLAVDGKYIWEAIEKGAKLPERPILLCASPTRAAVRLGEWKLVMKPASRRKAKRTPGKGRRKKKTTKQTSNRDGGRPNKPVFELYHLGKDIGEQKNLADVHPEKVAMLRRTLEDFLRDAVRPGNQVAKQ